MGCFQSKPSNELTLYGADPNGNKGNKVSHSKSIFGSSPSDLTNKSTLNLFMSNKERSLILRSDGVSMSTKLLLSPPFTNFSLFTRHLYLTGVGGVTAENLKQHKIKCMINVSDEIPEINFCSAQSSIIYHKFSISESYNFQIYEYFDRVGEVINQVINQNSGNVALFCVAGMSRTSAIALAYAIKFCKMTLKNAFQLLQDTRPYARPNLAFFHQLVLYERECFGYNSVKMVQEAIKDHMEVSESICTTKSKGQEKSQRFLNMPDFYQLDYPHLHKLEMLEATKNTTCITVPMIEMFANGKSNSRKRCSRKTGSSSNRSGTNRSGSDSGGNVHKCPSAKSTRTLEVTCTSTNELKPFIVEIVSYDNFMYELQQTRNYFKATQSCLNSNNSNSLTNSPTSQQIKLQLHLK